MFAFLIRRLIQAILVMFVISLISFSIQDNLLMWHDGLNSERITWVIHCAKCWVLPYPRPSANACARKWDLMIHSWNNTGVS